MNIDGLIQLRGINEFPISTLGHCIINIEFNSGLIPHKFFVVNDDFPIKSDGILGLDFLTKHEAVINCSKLTCKINSQDFPLEQKILGISINDKLIIQPRTQTIIPINVLNSLEKGIIPSKEISPNVFICSSLISKNFPISSVLNLNEESIEISIPSFELEPYSDDFIDILNVSNSKSVRLSNLENILRLDHLNCQEKESIIKICKEFNDLFFLEGDSLGATSAIKHNISITKPDPINVKPYRVPECHKEEIDRQMKDLEQQGIIKKSTSPWNAPLLVVPKKVDASGKKKWRVVVDYRKLNNVTVGDAFPLPNINEILDQLGNSKYFSTLDLASGFHQVPMDENDSLKTAFSTRFGHYEFCRMPFGLKGAPATFQRLMNSVLSGLIGIHCFVYLDDVVIYGNSLEDHNKKLVETVIE